MLRLGLINLLNHTRQLGNQTINPGEAGPRGSHFCTPAQCRARRGWVPQEAILVSSVPLSNTEGHKGAHGSRAMSKHSQGALSFTSGLCSQRLASSFPATLEAENLATQVLGFHSQGLRTRERSIPLWLACRRSCSAPWSYPWSRRAGPTIGSM